MKVRFLALAALTSFIVGCAKVDHAAVTDDFRATGIRYYRSSPYLLVYTNSKGGLKWQILYLPDQTKKMAAEPWVIGGRSEVAMFFQNGILSNTSEVGDTTALPKAIIAAIQSALPQLIGPVPLAGPTQTKAPAPHLYKIIVERNTIHFVGGQGDVSIIVPTLEGS